MIDLGRRQFLCSLGTGVLAFGSMGNSRPSSRQYFTWAQLKYPGGWDPNPRGAERFLSELRRRTSIEPEMRRILVEPGDQALFGLPFLCISGRGGFPDLGISTVQWLRRYVEYGGFVLIDDAGGVERSPFATGVGKLLDAAFPGEPLAPLPGNHTVFQSFYLLNRVAGRKVVRPILSGIDRDGVTPVLFCHNDLCGAFEGDPTGDYSYPCVPGGEEQREYTYRMGINIVMYALSDNYKKDQVHIPFILKRRQRQE